MRARSLPWAVRHLEKAIFSAALGWLAIVTVGFALPAGDLDPAPLRRALVQIKRYMNQAHVGEVVRPDWSARLAERFGDVPTAIPFRAWIAHQRPVWLFLVGPGLPPLDCRHQPSAVTSVDTSTRGRVDVVWRAGGHGKHVLVDYALERRVGDGPWIRLPEFDGEAEFVDTSPTPAQEHAYRVVSHARLDLDDALVQEHGIEQLPKEIPETLAGTVGAATTPANTIFVLNSVIAPPPGPHPLLSRPTSAQIYVYRWNPRTRRFDRRLFQVGLGQPIGQGDYATEAVLESVELVDRPIRGTDRTRSVGVATIVVGGRTLTLDDQTPFQD